MGCFRTIGCVTVLAIAAGAGWYFFRDDITRWAGRDAVAVESVEEAGWQPLTPAGARRARTSVARLEQASGQVFENIAPNDLAAYVFMQLAKGAIPQSENPEARVEGDELFVRASVRPRDIGAREALGPLAGVLSERERLEFGGRLEVIRPGLAQFRVSSLRLGTVSVPRPLIPKLVKQIDRGVRPEGITDDGLPLEIPDYITDIRVASGTVTLYRGAPEAQP
ncbi:MAG: hypothetical protein M3373_03510 [Gemmatimonadota bacterium]|nr:hypothetical protein [Gemmatimonadota bacterium]